MNFRLFAMVVVVLVFTVTLATFLNHNKFRKTLLEQERSRFEVVGMDLVESIHRGFDLGIGLHQMSYIEDVVARLRADDPRIDGVYVFDALGRVLYQNGVLVRDTAEQAWRWRSDGGLWHHETEAGFLVGFDLRNNFGGHVGGLTIEYGRATIERRLARLLARQILEAVAIVVVGGLIGLILVNGLIRRGLAPLRRIMANPATESGELSAAYAHFRTTVGETVRDLDAIDRALTESRKESSP